MRLSPVDFVQIVETSDSEFKEEFEKGSAFIKRSEQKYIAMIFSDEKGEHFGHVCATLPMQDDTIATMSRFYLPIEFRNINLPKILKETIERAQAQSRAAIFSKNRRSGKGRLMIKTILEYLEKLKVEHILILDMAPTAVPFWESIGAIISPKDSNADGIIRNISDIHIDYTWNYEKPSIAAVKAALTPTESKTSDEPPPPAF